MIYTRQGRDLGRAMTLEQAGQMNQMLREVLVSGSARKAELPGWLAAGKTGTTQDHRDAWFIGFTGHLVTGVWVGNDDGEEMKKVTGSGLPAEIWNRFMREAHQGAAVAGLPGLGWRSAASQPNAGGPIPATGPILPGNAAPPRPRASVPVAEDVSPQRFIQQQGPSQNDRNLLQRLLGG